MNKEEFTKLIKFLGLAYNVEIDKEQIVVWYSFFKNENEKVFKQAIRNIIQKQKFFPSIAEIKEEIAKMFTSDIPEAEDEWVEVLKLIKKYGSYKRQKAIEEMKPLTAYIVNHIGYINICMAENQSWNKKNFIEEYNLLKNRKIENIQIDTNALFDIKKYISE